MAKEERELTHFEKIMKERAEADALKKTPRIKGLEDKEPREVLEKNIVIENNLKVVNELIRKHGIIQVPRYSKHKKKKLAAQERFLNVLDMLYEKAIKTSDVKAAIEYLNRTAGSVSQTFDLNQNNKKLIMMGTMQSKGEQKKEAYKEIAKIPPIAKKKEDE